MCVFESVFSPLYKGIVAVFSCSMFFYLLFCSLDIMVSGELKFIRISLFQSVPLCLHAVWYIYLSILMFEL